MIVNEERLWVTELTPAPSPWELWCKHKPLGACLSSSSLNNLMTPSLSDVARQRSDHSLISIKYDAKLDKTHSIISTSGETVCV